MADRLTPPRRTARDSRLSLPPLGPLQPADDGSLSGCGVAQGLGDLLGGCRERASRACLHINIGGEPPEILRDQESQEKVGHV